MAVYCMCDPVTYYMYIRKITPYNVRIITIPYICIKTKIYILMSNLYILLYLYIYLSQTKLALFVYRKIAATNKFILYIIII